MSRKQYGMWTKGKLSVNEILSKLRDDLFLNDLDLDELLHTGNRLILSMVYKPSGSFWHDDKYLDEEFTAIKIEYEEKDEHG